MAGRSNKDGFLGKHTLFALVLIWGVEAAAIGAFVPNTWIVDALERERSMVHSWMGDELAREVASTATAWFNTAFRETGLIKGSLDAVTPTAREKARSGALSEVGSPLFDWLRQRIKVFWAAVFQSVQRLVVFWSWIPSLGIVLVPALVDGLLRREIKKRSYGYASPVRFRTTAQLVLFVFLLFAIYLGAPLAISPQVAPALGFGLSVILMVQLANLQKRL